MVCSAHRLLNDMHSPVSRCALLAYVKLTHALEINTLRQVSKRRNVVANVV